MAFSSPRALGRPGRLLILAVAVTALALPATAQAVDLNAKTVKKNRGFKLSLSASQGQGGFPDSLNANLAKGRELDSYFFSKGITFTAAADLSSADIKGKFKKHKGSIKMHFHSTGPKRSNPVPKGCTGTPGSRRKGVLKGKFKLKADHLGTIRVTKDKATLSTPPFVTGGTCGGGGGGGHGTTLSGFRSGHGKSASVFATKPRKGKVTEFVSSGVFGSGFSFNHSMGVVTSRSNYTFSKNLKKGHVHGPGTIFGNASYKGSAAVNGFSNGKVGGTLKGHSAAIGTIKPFSKGKMPAQQRRF